MSKNSGFRQISSFVAQKISKRSSISFISHGEAKGLIGLDLAAFSLYSIDDGDPLLKVNLKKSANCLIMDCNIITNS
jgi:hypothetical protein